MSQEDLFMNAQWIWLKNTELINLYLDFYDEFEMFEQHSDKVMLYISVSSNYAVYINGQFVNSGQYPDYGEYQVYDCLDITSVVTMGKNKIHIIGYSIGEDCSTHRKEQGGLIFSIWDGTNTLLNSSANCKLAQSRCYFSGDMEKVSSQQSFTFKYDSTYETEIGPLELAQIINKSKELHTRPVKKLTIAPNETAALFSQGVFLEGNPITEDIGERMQVAFLSQRRIGYFCEGIDVATYLVKHYVPNEEGYHFKAKQDEKCDGIYIVLDLEKENVGYPSIDIELGEPCEILIGYGEHLEDLRVRAYIEGRNFCTAYQGKKGRNTFFNSLKRIGLRYLQLHVYSKSFTLYYAGVKPTIYPLSNVPNFHCLDSLHNKIFEVSKYTLELCMHDHYEDCPWREQALYTMDSRNQMLCGYYTFGEYEFPKATLRLIAKSIREDGTLELCPPGRLCLTIPAFTAVYILQLYEYLMYSGDLEFIKEIYPVAEYIMSKFKEKVNETISLIPTYKGVEYWNYYEWREGSDGIVSRYNTNLTDTIYEAPFNAFVSIAARSFSKICKHLMKTDEYEEYEQFHLSLNKAINKIFWDKEQEGYVSVVSLDKNFPKQCSEFVQSLIIFADGCPDNNLDTVLEKMVAGEFVPITLSHSIFKYDALMRRPEKYGQFVWDSIGDIWGDMLYKNATTFWEEEDGAMAFHDSGSLCHGWSAIPAYMYFAYGIGVKPTELGFSKYVVLPKFDTKYLCEGEILTNNGVITVNK